MSMGFLDILSLDGKCFVKLSPFMKLISQFTVPFVMLGILSVITACYMVVLISRRKRLKAISGGEHVPWVKTAPFIDAYINLFGICTVPLLHTSFQLLICRKVGAVFVLKLAPDVECYTGPHSKWVAFATGITAFYILVFPLVVYFRRRRATQRILSQRFWQRNVSQLRAKIFKLHMFWWELAFLARDVMLVLMYVLWLAHPRQRTLSILMILFMSFIAHCYALPFVDRWDNAIETTSLLTLCYTAFVWHYPNRFQLSNERTDALVKNIFLYTGFASTATYIASRVSYELIGRFFLPMYAVDPSDYDVHHTPHT
ncbi:uncharacterized protein AMSG_11741 [Thecamonas trahens ATCC 50062]|uniref:Uncharacterized protein n=1 Tax=Thecamonas trahens ATCC 50062 TaxID=461836 RepID=A0A0L0D366_THETB|nr:hypothetical protein AMSG_11741 [Thecamonas trahens ATCC 50062]KNC46605.1 hypothetical protein AMSG_11741 [Thecamonas trahens ATCC 50062]|eukprot:XP_013760490.1 hypothetical protein AMSG_11741 [Thecamonas trahens ATCC 50062]